MNLPAAAQLPSDFDDRLSAFLVGRSVTVLSEIQRALLPGRRGTDALRIEIGLRMARRPDWDIHRLADARGTWGYVRVEEGIAFEDPEVAIHQACDALSGVLEGLVRGSEASIGLAIGRLEMLRTELLGQLRTSSWPGGRC